VPADALRHPGVNVGRVRRLSVRHSAAAAALAVVAVIGAVVLARREKRIEVPD
jgi:hypothetical protein